MKKGFTLIELLFTLAIVSILVAIAYPNYQTYITQARRNDGQTALMALASRMEYYHTKNNTYRSARLGRQYTADLTDENSPEGWYVLSIPHATDSTYTLQATPVGSQGLNDTRCQSLTLNHSGSKGIKKGPAGTPLGSVDECW